MKTPFPTFQQLLQHLHQASGLPQPQTVIKQRFMQQEMTQERMSTHIEELLDELFQEIDADSEAIDALKINLIRFSRAYTELFSKTWTYKADTKNVIWHLLGYFFSPTIARHIAFWNLNIYAPLDKGMPRGRFWYLPEFVYPKHQGQVYLPVEQVLDWLLDLIDGNVSDLANAYDKAFPNEKEDLTSISRKLNKWRKGTLPDNKGIKEVFSDNIKYDFKGILRLNTSLTIDEQYQEVCKFLGQKHLSDDEIELQLGCKKPSLNAPSQEKECFIEYALERYQQPTNKTIRTRLIWARIIQESYIKLLKYLFIEVDLKCVDINENKLLQVFEIYKRIYSLTIEAWNVKGRLDTIETRNEEDAYFEETLLNSSVGGLGIDAYTLYASILPSYIPTKESLFKAAEVLCYMFEHYEKNEELPNLICRDCDKSFILKYNYIKHVKLREKEYCSFTTKLKSENDFDYAIKDITSFYLLAYLFENSRRADCKKSVIRKMKNIAKSNNHKMLYYGYCLNYLFTFRKSMSNQKVYHLISKILEKSKLCADYELFKPLFLKYESRHLLNQNKKEEALNLLKSNVLENFEPCHYGKLIGELIKDYMAIKIAIYPTKISQNNDEKYFRECLDYGLFSLEDDVHTFDDFIKYCKAYFKNTLYQPYE